METIHTHISIQEFEVIFKRHYAELCGYANSILSDIDAAEEAVQSVFVKVWENRSMVSIQTSIKSYLYSAVKNDCLNQLKHLKIKEAYKAHNQYQIELEQSDGENEIQSTELEEKIHQSIEKLPESRKKIFILSRYEGLKYKEIAEKLNLSIKTVENQMGSAIKQLRVDLAEFISLLLVILFNGWN